MNDILEERILKEVLNSQVSVESILIVLVLSTALGLAISAVYKKTFRGTAYSASFIAALVLISIITANVMMIIGSNLARAFGFIGALSIIRFRTAIKDTRDLSFIFLSLIMGAAVGTQNYHIAVISTFFILMLVYALDRLNYGSFTNNAYFLTIDVHKKDFSENDFKPLLDRFTSSYSLNSVNSLFESEDVLRLVYKVGITKKSETEALSGFRRAAGVRNVTLSSADNYVSY